MTDEAVEALLLARYHVRADPATRRYVADRLAGGAPFAILAGCARTGRPMCPTILPPPPEAAVVAR